MKIKAEFTNLAKEKSYNAPLKMTKVMNGFVMTISLASGYVEVPSGFEKITMGYTVVNSKNNKLIRVFERTVLFEGRKAFNLAWNPLADNDLLDDFTRCKIDVFVKSKGKYLARKSLDINVGNIKKNIIYINDYIKKLNRKPIKKLKLEGTSFICCSGSYSNGREGDIWTMLNGVLCGADVLDVRIRWSSLNPEPDKYDWRVMDRAVQNAEKLKVPIVISLVNFLRDMPIWWLSKSTLAATNNKQYRLLKPSYLSKDFRDKINASIKKVVERYKNKKVIIAWNFNVFNNDGFYDDSHGHWLLRSLKNAKKYLYDYSPVAQTGFQKYLINKYGNISKINQVFNTKYKTVKGISIPQPVWGKYDKRQIWSDFTDFKIQSAADFIDSNFAAIREIDPDRWIYSFCLKGGDLVPYLKVMKKHKVIMNYSVYGPIAYSAAGFLAKQMGVPSITEDCDFRGPLARWIFERKLFENVVSGIDAYFAMNAYYGKSFFPVVFKKWTKIFKELVNAEAVPPLLGVNISPYSWLARYKTFYFYYDYIGHEISGTHKFSFECLRKILLNNAYSHEVVDSAYDFALKRYSVIIDADSKIVKPEAIDRLVNYVKNGGTLICTKYSDLESLKENADTFWKRINCTQSQRNNSNIFTFGKGKIYFVKGDVDWRKAEFQQKLVDVMNKSGMYSRVLSPIRNIRLVLLKKQDSYYVAGYNDNSNARNIKLQIILSQNSKAKKYKAYNMFDSIDMGIHSIKDLQSKAMSIRIDGKRAFFIKLTPVE